VGRSKCLVTGEDCVGYIVAVVAANGVKRLRQKCVDCHFLFGGDISYQGELVDEYFVVEDNRYEFCEHCGKLGAESHHWAPLSKFTDASDWPLGWLCPPCHREWHKVMR
jgi:hypothetical protein